MFFSLVAVREVGVEVTKMFDGNYPENLRRVFIVNGNFAFITAVLKTVNFLID